MPQSSGVARRRAWTLVALALASLLGEREASAQLPDACSNGRISVIFVDNHSVFDMDEVPRARRFRWAYGLANSLHMRTREDFLRSELLFREGDCYEVLRLEESGRMLREYSFISRADVFGLRQADGDWHVVVDTTDEWTTELNVRFNFEEGVEFRGVDITEENLTGRGLILGAFLSQRNDRRDVGGIVASPRLFGTRMDATFSAGNTRVGSFFDEQIAYPFVAELGRMAGRQAYLRRDDRFTFWHPDGSALLLPFDLEAFDVTVLRRWGRPGDLTVLGLGVSHHSVAYPDLPAGIEIAYGGNFGDTEPAPAELADQVLVQTGFGSSTRINAIVGQRNVHFVRRRGIDALTGLIDVPKGLDVGLTLGYGLNGFSHEHGDITDLYSRLSLFMGGENGPFLANFNGVLEGRQILQGAGGRGWRDVLGEVDALLYVQPAQWASHTFFARASASGGWNPEIPFQLTLGGSEGLRGYREERFPGASRIVFSFEDRVYVPWPAPELFDLGFTLLADVGRMWPGDIPFGTDSGWRGAIGGGIRFGFPAGSRGVVRADLAFPFDGAGISNPVFRLSLLDLLGLRRALQDRQLQRSRINSIGPDLFTGRASIF